MVTFEAYDKLQIQLRFTHLVHLDELPQFDSLDWMTRLLLPVFGFKVT
jgi:hypothetical protein